MDKRSPLSKAQKDRAKDDVSQAIGRICDAWPEAVVAAEARGYPRSVGSSEPTTGGGISDPTASRALVPDAAEEWLYRARRTLALVLKFTDATYAGRRNGEFRWTGAFDPTKLRQTLQAAATELVELWPKRIEHLFERLYALADQALQDWPPTPKPNDVIDGVTVGKRSPTVENCAECGQPVLGGAADPLARIDGKPYHRQPCYNTVYVRQRRKRAVNNQQQRQQRQ